jgi:lipid-A-disaccharide synthase-like uncharacterized protein
MMLQSLASWFDKQSATELTWLAIGFLAQGMFMMRFVIQWLASERVKRSIVPETFWYFSLGGGVMLLAYSLWRMDPVYILGQTLGTVIYARNIYFIWTHKQANSESAAEPSS